MIRGVNHITLAVTDVERSFRFYRDLLGFQAKARWPRGAYFAAGELWFCIVLDEAARAGALPDYTHLALAIDASDFVQLSLRIRSSGCREWKQNQSEGDSLYFLDPDGHKLELHVTDLDERLRTAREQPWEGLEFFD